LEEDEEKTNHRQITFHRKVFESWAMARRDACRLNRPATTRD